MNLRNLESDNAQTYIHTMALTPLLNTMHPWFCFLAISAWTGLLPSLSLLEAPLPCLCLITASTPPTSTVHTLHHRALRQLGLRHPTHTRRPKIRLLGLNTFQATQLFIALFLPPRNQIRIRIILLQQPLIQLRRNRLALIVKIVDVPGPLVVDLEYRPQGFVFLLDVVLRRFD